MIKHEIFETVISCEKLMAILSHRNFLLPRVHHETMFSIFASFVVILILFSILEQRSSRQWKLIYRLPKVVLNNGTLCPNLLRRNDAEAREARLVKRPDLLRRWNIGSHSRNGSWWIKYVSFLGGLMLQEGSKGNSKLVLFESVKRKIMSKSCLSRSDNKLNSLNS